MIYKVEIKDNKKCPFNYVSDIEAFENGTIFTFKPGVNIIIGENGCGKSTLMGLIKKYLLIEKTEVTDKEIKRGLLEWSWKGKSEDKVSGIRVKADYGKNTFVFLHLEEYEKCDAEYAMKSFRNFGAFFDMKNSSTGESVIISINNFFAHIFSNEINPFLDYKNVIQKEIEYYKKDGNDEKVKFLENYIKYIDENNCDEINEHTILFDEPDRNLGLENLENIKPILDYHKEGTQVICVIHNPLLIYSLSKNKEINFIEMTKGYKDKIINEINKLVK